jgi:hypothetical protein
MTTKPNTPHITQVRQALLDTLADLRDRSNPMDIDRAKAVATVAGVLVDSARVENDYLKLTGQDRSAFLEVGTEAGLPAISATGTPSANNPFPTSVVHRLQG